MELEKSTFFLSPSLCRDTACLWSCSAQIPKVREDVSVVRDGAVRRRMHRRRLRDGRPRSHHSLGGHRRRRRRRRYRGRRGRRRDHRHRHVRRRRLRQGRRRGDGESGVQGFHLLRVSASGVRREISKCSTPRVSFAVVTLSHLIHCPVTSSFL